MKQTIIITGYTGLIGSELYSLFDTSIYNLILISSSKNCITYIDNLKNQEGEGLLHYHLQELPSN